MAFGKCGRVWGVLPNCFANVGESGESLPNCLANVGESGESQHFLGFGHFLLAKFAKFAKFAKLQSLEILNESSMLKRLNEHIVHCCTHFICT
jgi:hypothetical protein